MAVIVNIKLTWSLFYVLSVSEFIIRTIRTPARRVCGSIYRYMPRSKVCIPDAMKFWKKPWRWSVRANTTRQPKSDSHAMKMKKRLLAFWLVQHIHDGFRIDNGVV